jgi:hypothetical protein
MLGKTAGKIAQSIYERPPIKTKTMSQIVHRVGALEVLEMPSRIGGSLHYPDGRVVKDGK